MDSSISVGNSLPWPSFIRLITIYLCWACEVSELIVIIIFQLFLLHCDVAQCLSQGSIPAQTSWPRSKLGRKGFIQLTLPYRCSSPKEVRTGTQASQKAGADAEAMEGCSLLACFPGLLSLLSYRIKTTSPEMVPPTRGLSPLITNWENALQLDLVEAFPQLKLLFQ